ncbi:tRNA pseudouridine(38-40) synthase TruA [Aquimarina agarivorans]|uniref:tRNA pseudouridine(38-40) synthase TruA n=1 Tax=Aquimarina agarivorans TaxID=980584 RepID=UPI000248EF92|nr:tRNA pseudouridine(38-40) synthase TruA [Aquimarina agarivorans]
MRYFIELSYNGTSFHGWQKQPNAASVQESVEKALSVLLRESVTIMGAGRTDTGVHAKYIAAHFDTQIEFDVEKLVFKLNSFLPPTIAIKNIFSVAPDAHARFDAISRAYEYRIVTHKNPFETASAYYITGNLDIAAMNSAAQQLLKYTNFKCFSKSKTDVKTYNCQLFYAFWEQQHEVLVFKISANRFLRNMVRAIVGTLIEVGQGKLKLSDIDRILASENRSEAGYSVPAKGLYLTEVLYPKTIYPINERKE